MKGSNTLEEESVKDDLIRLLKCLDAVLDNCYDSCGFVDEEANGMVEDFKKKYLKGEKQCI